MHRVVDSSSTYHLTDSSMSGAEIERGGAAQAPTLAPFKRELTALGSSYLTPDQARHLFPLSSDDHNRLIELSDPEKLFYEKRFLAYGFYTSYNIAHISPADKSHNWFSQEQQAESEARRVEIERIACSDRVRDFFREVSGIPDLEIHGCRITCMIPGNVIDTHSHKGENEMQAFFGIESATQGGQYTYTDRGGRRGSLLIEPGGLMLALGDITERVENVFEGRRRSLIYFLARPGVEDH